MLTDEQYLRNALVAVAKMFVGVREVGGNNRGEFVERFQRAVDNKAESEAWCMAFVQYCLQESRKLTEAIFLRSMSTPNKIFSSEHCLTVWNKTDKFQRLEQPIVGSLIIWQKYRLDVPTTSGHVGIVSRVLDSGTISTIEGNTSGDDPDIVRDGAGVYETTRFWHQRYGDMRFVGFLNSYQD